MTRKTERQKSANEIYKINNSVPIKDKRIILVDDVLTTGATLRACRDILEKQGRKVVGAVVLAMA